MTKRIENLSYLVVPSFPGPGPFVGFHNKCNTQHYNSLPASLLVAADGFFPIHFLLLVVCLCKIIFIENGVIYINRKNKVRGEESEKDDTFWEREEKDEEEEEEEEERVISFLFLSLYKEVFYYSERFRVKSNTLECNG